MSSQTRSKLLKEAYFLMCTNGYSGFSYADLATTIGITKASIHHHFPTKEILGEQVILNAYEETLKKLEEIKAQFPMFDEQIENYMYLFVHDSEITQLPLCCSLSSEFENLPLSIQRLTKEYFELQVNWLKQSIISAQGSHEVDNSLDPEDLALTIIKLFEGTSIVNRVLNQHDSFTKSLQLIKLFINKNRVNI